MADVTDWALPRLEKLLPLDQESLRQILQYANSLDKKSAAEHLQNLLGDNSQSIEFITAFNARRKYDLPTNTTLDTPSPDYSKSKPSIKSKQTKIRPNIHELPARQIDGQGSIEGAYRKDARGQNGLNPQRYKTGKDISTTSSSLSSKPELSVGPKVQTLNVVSTPSSRTNSPSNQSSLRTKVAISGGKPMHGQSTNLSDLDSAIRSLELQTNPLLSTVTASSTERQCDCMATIHPLLTMAPNCLFCGNIICLKQGLGPCISCNTPLLSSEEISNILIILKEERGKERQLEGNKAHKKAEISTKPKAFSGRDFLSSSTSSTPSPLANISPIPTTDALNKAQSHRDTLLSYQSQNAKRTQIHDEASDFSVPVLSASGDGTYRSSGGSNLWASPVERAKELKKQQAKMREMEFNSRPEWERKRVVGEIDISTGKVVKRFVQETFHDSSKDEDEGDDVNVGDGEDDDVVDDGKEKGNGGVFSHNPLLGKLIRPVWKGDGKVDEKGKGVDVQNHDDNDEKNSSVRDKKSTWRKVQDDYEDNEKVILDGGIKGFGYDITVN